jgi:hypothetical protein
VISLAFVVFVGVRSHLLHVTLCIGSVLPPVFNFLIPFSFSFLAARMKATQPASRDSGSQTSCPPQPPTIQAVSALAQARLDPFIVQPPETISWPEQAMALQWSSPIAGKPKPMNSPLVIPPPTFSKHDLVFVLGMTDSGPNTSMNLCEVIDYGYRLQQGEYVYFCRTIDHLLFVQTILVCKDKYLRKPKYRTGLSLRVKDLDDWLHGIGIVSDWKVRVECLEYVNGKFTYWIKVPGAGKKKRSLLLDVDESKLELMVAAAVNNKKIKA